MKSYRNPRGLCAAAILTWLSATAGAAPLFTENFNGLSQSGTDVQETTGLKIGNGKSLTTPVSWTKAGDGTIHCVDRTGSGNWAVMFYGGNSAAGDNVITSPAIAAANTLNKTYRVTFDLSAANYKNTGQRNNGTTDGVTVTVLNSSAGTIKTQTFVPGSFVSLAAAGSLTFTTVSFDYVGTGFGTGAASFKFTATNPTSVGRFGGSIDNLSVSEAGPTLVGSGIVDDKGGASVTTGTLVTYTVTFSQDMDATTVDAADFGNAGTAGVSIGTVTETAPTSGIFTVPVTPTSAGTLQLKVNAGAVLNDAGGVPLVTTAAIADDTTLTVATPGDTTPPTLTSITDDKSPGAAERNALVTYTVTFNEAMDPGTVTAAGFGNAGGAAVTIGTVTPISSTVFSVPVTPTTTGSLQLRVIAGAELKDVAGNALVVPSPAGIPDDTTLTVADTIAPALTSIVDDKSPATIAPNTLVTYTVTFSEDMDAGTVTAADFGNPGSADVTIGAVTETTPTSGIFTVQATPTSGGTLRLQVNQDAELKDAAGNALVTASAILDDTTITVDGTPPDIATLSPADDATDGGVSSNLMVTFSEAIVKGTGNITIKNLTDNSQTTIAITDGTQVSVSGTLLRIGPTVDLAMLKSYAIQIDATAIKDLAGNFFAGIADDTTWNFTTGTTWSLAKGFNIAANSDSTTWSYRTFSGGAYALLANNSQSANTLWGTTFASPPLMWNGGVGSYWGIGRNDSGVTQNSASVNGWAPGAIYCHPDTATGGLVVGWLAPQAMTINANYTFAKVMSIGANGIRYSITKRAFAGGDTTLKPLTVINYGTPLTDSLSGLSVAAGDRLYFFLDNNTNGGGDISSAAINISAVLPTLVGSGIVDDKGGASVTTGTLVTYTVTFSGDMDAITVDAADFGNAGTAAVTIGTVTETAPSSGVFTVQVTPTSAGTLQLQVNAGAVLNDAGGFPLNTTAAIADDTTLIVVTPGDTTPPTLTSIADDKSGGPAERNDMVTYTVTFNEDMDATTVTAADFGNAGSAAVTIGTVTETTLTSGIFTVQVTPTTTGTLQLKVNAGAELKDVAGNALVTTSAIPDDTTLAVNDTIPPTLTGIVDDKSPATIAPNTLVTYTVTFSEDMDAGTVSAADFGNPGSADVTIGTVTETTPGVFTVQATPTSAGTLRLQVNQDAELKDAAGNALVTTSAILDDTTITVDGVPPAIATLSPADDATGVVVSFDLIVTFSEAIAKGTGNITIKNLTDNSQTTIAITDGTQVSVSGAVMTINPTADLATGKNYAVLIAATAITDLAGNFFAGIAADTTWNFTTGNTIFAENFNGYSGTEEGPLQYQTGLNVAFGGSVSRWSKSGDGTMHAVDLNGTGNWAIMFWQNNVITLTTGIAANSSGVTYKVDFDYGTAVYRGGENVDQRTTAPDGLLVEILRPDNSVLASNTYQPGAWDTSGNRNLDAGRHGTLQYVGDDSGVVRLRIGPKTPTLDSTRFEGEIDNLSVSLATVATYATWAAANGIPGEPPTGDFDRDGLTNLMEYALGKDPKVSSQPAGELTGKVITFTKGADAIANGDVSWVIQTSTTLAADSWTPQVTQAAGNPSATITYTLPDDVGGKVFARLVVTMP